MKTRTQFKVNSVEEFKEAMKVLDFKNKRVAKERFDELGYRYVTKFPTHIDISQRIEHYELVDNPITGLFNSSIYVKLNEDKSETVDLGGRLVVDEDKEVSFDEQTGIHYVSEKEEAVDFDDDKETKNNIHGLTDLRKHIYKYTDSNLEMPISEYMMNRKGDVDKGAPMNYFDEPVPDIGEEVEFITQKEFMDKLNSNINEDELESTCVHDVMYGAKDEKEEGLRYNKGKRRWSLVDFEALEEMVKVLEFGAEKYDDHNWKKGMSVSEVSESLMRHMFAFLRGEDNDKESGFSHLGHVQCNAMFLSYIMKHKNQFDDRFNSKKTK